MNPGGKAAPDMMLQVESLTAHYGGIRAISDVSINVPKGAAVAILGPNGAGKSTTIKCVMGLVRPTGGHIRLEGEEITGIPPYKVVAHGVALVHEGRGIFPYHTVDENLDLGASIHNDAQVRTDLDRVYALFPVLAERRRQTAGLLSGGEQQMLAIGRALMARPKILLLDEPSMGLGPIIITEVFSKLREIQQSGVTVLLVEQNTMMALRFASYAYVLQSGSIVHQGDCEGLRKDTRVLEAYLA